MSGAMAVTVKQSKMLSDRSSVQAWSGAKCLSCAGGREGGRMSKSAGGLAQYLAGAGGVQVHKQ